jgi:hypothetical protein
MNVLDSLQTRGQRRAARGRPAIRPGEQATVLSREGLQ